MPAVASQTINRIAGAVWPALLMAWVCAVAVGCSPRDSAADAGGVADVGSDVGVDVAGDGLDSVDVSVVDVEDGETAEAGDTAETEVGDSSDVGDAITDAGAGDGADIDVVEVDVPVPVDATPAVDAAVPCSATEVPAALTGTVEFEAAAYIYNPVVMGCGKGPPKSVKDGAPCCDCPPPYSCYCSGQCGWLRAPDLAKPQQFGQAVWTGKWVVSLGESAEQYNKPSSMNLQRWQPGSGKGFELVPLPSAGFPIGDVVLLLFEKKVVVAVACCQGGSTTYTPADPVYLYDPDSNTFSMIKMPLCGRLLISGGTLVCVAAWQSGPPVSLGGLYIYEGQSGKWKFVQPPAQVVGTNWGLSYPRESVADDQTVYFVGAVTSASPWPDGTPGWPGPGHILKYEFKINHWVDIGFVPEGWDAGPVILDHIGIVRIKGAIQAARFRLDTLQWEVGPKFFYSQFGHQEPTLTACGLLFGSGTLDTAAEGGGMSYRPVLLAGDLSWKLLAPWGYPNDAVTSRKGSNVAITDKEIFALGGMDGPPDGNFVYHRDSYRYPLSALCPGGPP